jgi:pimeloyl-ACP methyl ester carboxylesterase
MFGGFKVNFLPELKHLHDAGYNILTYDLRNHGLSGEANGVISGLGLLECRDVVGSIRYAKSQKNLKAMNTGLYSRCMGGQLDHHRYREMARRVLRHSGTNPAQCGFR